MKYSLKMVSLLQSWLQTLVNPQIESGFDELECILQDVQNYGVIQTFRFIQREKSRTDSNAKISPVYELKTKILKKKIVQFLE